jgi:hypothetical protein
MYNYHKLSKNNFLKMKDRKNRSFLGVGNRGSGAGMRKG